MEVEVISSTESDRINFKVIKWYLSHRLECKVLPELKLYTFNREIIEKCDVKYSELPGAMAWII